MKRLFTLLSILCLCSLIFAFDVGSVTLHVYLSELKTVTAPVIVENNAVFTVQGVYRSVGIAFSHENWAETHYFQKNRHGIFVFVLPIPFEVSSPLLYRLVIDGVWCKDSANPQTLKDFSTGTSFSVLDIPFRSKQVYGTWNPADSKDGYVTFYYKGKPEQFIYVTGNFSNWDPFLYEMEEQAPGEYWLKLLLPPGTYYYVFIIQGEKVPDPLNNRVVYTKEGKPVSELVVNKSGK